VESFTRRPDILDVGVLNNLLNVTDQVESHYFGPIVIMIYHEQDGVRGFV
jgi:hypothetical protein